MAASTTRTRTTRAAVTCLSPDGSACKRRADDKGDPDPAGGKISSCGPVQSENPATKQPAIRPPIQGTPPFRPASVIRLPPGSWTLPKNDPSTVVIACSSPRSPLGSQMSHLQKEARQHLDKTTNTIILDYLLWLAAKTILEEATAAADVPNATPPGPRSRGRRLVGLVDGLILTFDLTDRPKFSYPLLTRRIDLTSLVISFVYRDSQSQYITRRASETPPSTRRVHADQARTEQFLRGRGIRDVLEDDDVVRAKYADLSVTPQTRTQARALFGLDDTVPSLSDSGNGSTHGHGSTTSAPSRPITLRDALHQFVQVSASSYANGNASPNKIWIDLTVQFCMFAALEGYLVHGESGVDCLNGCFGYGILAAPDYGHPDLDDLFQDRRGSGSVGKGNKSTKSDFGRAWEDARRGALAQLVPPSSSSSDVPLASHFMTLLRRPRRGGYGDLKAGVTRYLGAILESMLDPDLCKYPAALDRSVLRAPGMISIAHEQHDVVTTTETTTRSATTKGDAVERKSKRSRVAA